MYIHIHILQRTPPYHNTYTYSPYTNITIYLYTNTNLYIYIYIYADISLYKYIYASIYNIYVASEVIIHGTPSGLDNTTSCYGGALSYKRPTPGTNSPTTPLFDIIPALPDGLRILVINTKVPRSTKKLVAHVKTLLDPVTTTNTNTTNTNNNTNNTNTTTPNLFSPVAQSLLHSIEGISQAFLTMLKMYNSNNNSSNNCDNTNNSNDDGNGNGGSMNIEQVYENMVRICVYVWLCVCVWLCVLWLCMCVCIVVMYIYVGI